MRIYFTCKHCGNESIVEDKFLVMSNSIFKSKCTKCFRENDLYIGKVKNVSKNLNKQKTVTYKISVGDMIENIIKKPFLEIDLNLRSITFDGKVSIINYTKVRKIYDKNIVELFSVYKNYSYDKNYYNIRFNSDDFGKEVNKKFSIEDTRYDYHNDDHTTLFKIDVLFETDLEILYGYASKKDKAIYLVFEKITK